MRRYLLHTLKTRLRAGRSLYLLTIFGVALGVASVLSVQIINLSAVAAFRGALRAVGSEADLTVRGLNRTLPESLFPEVLATRGVRGAWPVYRLDVAVKGSDSLLLEVMGIDLISPASRESLELLGREKASEGLTQPGWMAVTPELARAQGWSVGDSMEVSCGPREARLVIGALVDFARVTTLAGAKLAVMDISQVQGLLGRPGDLHEIHVEAAPEDRADLKALLERRLGPSVEVLTPTQREDEAAGLLSAFRLNLTALSLISLFVGSFVVYTSSQALLVRRRREFGVLRAVGATRGQLLGLIAFEAALVGALGVVLGTGLGYWAARANVDAVSATLTQVYLLNEITSLQVPRWVYLAGAAAGMGAALAGTLLPALDLCLSPPRSLLSSRLLQERVRTSAIPLALAGTGILAMAAAWYRFAADWRPAGFVLGVALLVSIPLFTPILVRAASLLPLSGLGVRYGFRSLAGRWTTTVFTASSLAIAVSMMVGVTLKTSSFRETLEVWLRTSVQADIYVKTESWRGRGDETALSPGLISRLSRTRDVVALDRYRRLTVRSGGERIFLAGVETSLPGGEARFPLTGGDPVAVYRQFREEGATLVGETLARRRGLEPGDHLLLVTPDGERRVPIAGIYYDYQPGTGLAVVGLETMERLFGPGPVHSVALYLESGADTGETVDRLRAAHAGDSLLFRSNRKLRQEVMEIFDQTFAVTRLLQGTSLLIAVAGIILTLLVLAREESAELALYRSLGARRSQLFRIFVGKGLGMGVAGLALGLAGGVLLAGILVFVINRAYFGWTIQVHWPWGTVLVQSATILAAAVLASLYPALAASRTPATQLSREDL